LDVRIARRLPPPAGSKIANEDELEIALKNPAEPPQPEPPDGGSKTIRAVQKTPSHRRPELRRRVFGGTLEDSVTTTVIFRVKAKGTPLSFWKTLFEVFIDDWSPKMDYDQRRAFFSLFLQLFAQ
jgi:hypothetical protein